MGKKQKKHKGIQLLEYGAARLLVSAFCFFPYRGLDLASRFLGKLFYATVSKRKNIALDNLHYAFQMQKADDELQRIAQESFISFIRTFLEVIKLQRFFRAPDAYERIIRDNASLERIFAKAKKIHDDAGGCIFVTPHIGNWELLPHVSAVVGIPLVVVVRPLDNPYLERFLYDRRAATGQIIIPKRNALFALQETLQQRRSIGMLPDQSTMKGIPVNFFGRKATTTPIPALLAIVKKRPIVVVACCRKEGRGFEGFVCDPIQPQEYESEKTEIFRITEEMNHHMESIVRQYPGQYLWMHNRWKTYNKKGFMA